MIQVNKSNTGGLPYSPGQERYFFISWNTNDPWIQLLWKEPHRWVSSLRYSSSQSLHHAFVVFVVIINWESLEWSLCFRRVSSGTFGHGQRLYKTFRQFCYCSLYTVIHLPLLSITFAHIYIRCLFHHQSPYLHRQTQWWHVWKTRRSWDVIYWYNQTINNKFYMLLNYKFYT